MQPIAVNVFQLKHAIKKKKPEKIKASTGIEPMTSAIPVQRSDLGAGQLRVHIYPVDGE